MNMPTHAQAEQVPEYMSERRRSSIPALVAVSAMPWVPPLCERGAPLSECTANAEPRTAYTRAAAAPTATRATVGREEDATRD